MDRCGELQAECICTSDLGHESPHVCDCGGSWDEVAGIFRVFSWPLGVAPAVVPWIEAEHSTRESGREAMKVMQSVRCLHSAVDALGEI